MVCQNKSIEIQIELSLPPNICTLEKKVDAVLGNFGFMPVSLLQASLAMFMMNFVVDF